MFDGSRLVHFKVAMDEEWDGSAGTAISLGHALGHSGLFDKVFDSSDFGDETAELTAAGYWEVDKGGCHDLVFDWFQCSTSSNRRL
mmetsp:Transcript_12747/g.19193  ORF Transcript_12747/g.19193 Transcript_12747/m.19193 type:complete len:86 (+) Transcript_12747:532-789(+)